MAPQVRGSTDLAMVFLVRIPPLFPTPCPVRCRHAVLTPSSHQRINIPFNVLTLAVVTLFFRPAQGRGGSVSGRIASLDLIGCFIFVPGIFMFLLAMQTGGGSGVWDTPEVIGLLAGSGVTLLLFAAWERRRGERAMIPGSVALRRTVVFTCLFASTQMGGLTVASYYLPVWFQGIQGVGPLQSGVRMLPTVITQMVSTMVASGLGELPLFSSLLFPLL